MMEQMENMGMEEKMEEKMENNTGMMEQPQNAMGITVEDIVKALMSGINPEELLKNGVPKDLIMQAIQIIEQQAAGTQAQEAPTQSGLSAMGM